MGLGDLFKSKKEREKERRKRKRMAFREAERAADTVMERVGKLKKERDRSWAEARQYLKDGQKAAAQRSLQTCRASELLIAKQQQKHWVFQQIVTKMELATTDEDFAKAIKMIDAVVNIDPEEVDSVLDEVQIKLGEQADSDKIWDRAYGKEMDGVEMQMSDTVLSVEDLMGQLTDEVAAEIGGGGVRTSEGEELKPLKDRIGEGHQRLRDLLEDDS